MTQDIQFIIDKFKKAPSYLKKGNTYLSELWSVSVEDVQRARIELNPSSEDVEDLPFMEALGKAKQGLISTKNIQIKSAWENSKGEVLCSYDIKQSHLTKKDIEDLIKSSVLPKKTKQVPSKGEEILVIEIPDLHIGKLGNEDVCDNVYNACLSIKNRVKNIAKVQIVNLGDAFNSDASSRSTTKGTKQEDSLDFKESFKRATGLFCSIIDMFSNVEFVNIPGNHSVATEHYLACYLEAYYKDMKVFHGGRQAFNYGYASVMYDHGEVKPKDYPYIFASEFPDIWAQGKQRFIICGHRHSQHIYEFPGCTLKFLSSAAKHTDNWHYTNGYVGARIGIQASVYNKEKGLVSTIYETF